ncbi:MAG: dihydrodipicolinate synthase family protein [Rhizobiaceae bacterium]
MRKPRGIVCPLLTPCNVDGSIVRDLWVSHAAWVLEQGAHYLSPFGTTGEATSFTTAQRIEALDWLIESGIPADRLMPGTGVPSLGETTQLSLHAARAGCTAVMVLPSFFYVQAGDDGQARFYTELVEAIADTGAGLILYHIPQNSGVKVSPSLSAHLAQAFPRTIVAYKDSSGDWNNTAAIIAAAPGLSVFPGSETFLSTGLQEGAAGCISATVNLNSAAIRAVHDGFAAGQDVGEADDAIKRFRHIVQDAGLIGSMKALLAVTSGDDRWLNLRPPHLDAKRQQGQALLAALGEMANHIPRH